MNEIANVRSGCSSFARIFDIDATFVSLHKELTADDAAVLNARREILHFGDALNDYVGYGCADIAARSGRVG